MPENIDVDVEGSLTGTAVAATWNVKRLILGHVFLKIHHFDRKFKKLYCVENVRKLFATDLGEPFISLLYKSMIYSTK